MSDYSQIADDIRLLFSTNFATTGNPAPIALPYDPGFEEPKDSYGRPLSWVRINVEIITDIPVTFGKPTGARFEVDGVVVVECFSPLGRGPGENETLVSDVIASLRNEETAGIEFQGILAIPVGEVEDIYLKKNVEATWKHFDG